MELIEYKDKQRIQSSKAKLEVVLSEVRKKIKKSNGITFANYIVGSGKHKMIFIPKNQENRKKDCDFDIDIQIVFQKYNGKSIKKSQTNIDYDDLMQTFLKALNYEMAQEKFQNSGGTHRVQKFYNPTHHYRYEILSIIEKNINNNYIQWNELIFNDNNNGFTLSEQEPYYDSLKNFKKSKKNDLKENYKRLREEEVDKKDKQPNFELLNRAIKITK